MAALLTVTRGASTLLPGTSWASPNALFDTVDRNDGSAYSWDSANSRLTLPATGLADGYLMIGSFEFEDTSNGRHNPQARFTQNSGTGQFTSAATGGFNRDNSEDRAYVKAWAFVHGPSASATFDFEWKRDTDTPTGGTVRSTLQVIPLYYSNHGIYESASTSAPGGNTPTIIGGFSAVSESDTAAIELSANVVTVKGDNKRYLLLGSYFWEGLGGRTSRWGGFAIDGTYDDALQAYTYYRNTSNDESGEMLSGMLETSTADRTIELRESRGPAIGTFPNTGASVTGTTTGSSPAHRMVVLELNDSAEVFMSRNASQQDIDVAGTRVEIDVTPAAGLDFNDSASFTRADDNGMNVEQDMDLLVGANLSGGYASTSTARYTGYAEITVNGVGQSDLFAGDYSRGDQSTQDVWGWSANLLSALAVTSGQDVGVNAGKITGGEGGTVDILNGFAAFWGVNLDTLEDSGGATHTASGTPSTPAVTASGAATVRKSASGAATIAAIVAAGAATVVTTATDGAPNTPAVEASGAAEIRKQASGSPSIPLPGASGAALVIKTASDGGPAIASIQAAGAASVGSTITASDGAPSIPVSTASGAATVVRKASGSPSTPSLVAAAVAEVVRNAAGGGSIAPVAAAGTASVSGTVTASGAPSIPAVTASGVTRLPYDSFDGSGALDSDKWQTYEAQDTSAALTVTQLGGRYNGAHSAGDASATTWFDDQEGRHDYVEFSGDFDFVIRNGGLASSPAPDAGDFQFFGLLVWLSSGNWEFAVCGNRGTDGTNTIEYKVTVNENSQTRDLPDNSIWNHKADLRVVRVGSQVDFYYQDPSNDVDNWILIDHDGLPGSRVNFGTGVVRVGMITYGFAFPAAFTGEADLVEILNGTPIAAESASGSATTPAVTASGTAQLVKTASGAASIPAIVGAGAAYLAPRVWLNTTPSLSGATQLDVTDYTLDGTSITFTDPVGPPTGSLWLGVENVATGDVGWIAVTVNAANNSASGAAITPAVQAAGTAKVVRVASGSPSIPVVTAAGVANLAPTVWLNTTPTKVGADRMTVTDYTLDGTSITFTDPLGGYTGSLWLGVENPINNDIAWIAVTVISGNNSASGAADIPAVSASGAATVHRASSGSPSLPSVTASGAAFIRSPVSGAADVPVPVASGTASLTRNASGAPSIPAIVASGAAQNGQIKSASGNADIPSITAAGVAGLSRSASGDATMPAVVASGTATVARQPSGAADTPTPVAAGAATVRRQVSGAAIVPAVQASGTVRRGFTAFGAGLIPVLQADGSALVGGIVVVSPFDGTGYIIDLTFEGCVVDEVLTGYILDSDPVGGVEADEQLEGYIIDLTLDGKVL